MQREVLVIPLVLSPSDIYELRLCIETSFLCSIVDEFLTKSG